MIELHQYPKSWNLPSSSPFCIKVETYLRMTQIPYKIVWENNPRRGPKGKMPFIVDGDKTVADSSFIIGYLQSKHNYPLDQSLTPQEKSQMLAFQRLIEESLYWVLLYSRWGDPDGWQQIKKEFTPFLPPIIGSFILKIIRKNLLRQAYHQGIARHSAKEIYSIGAENISALAEFLQDKQFFMGANPTTIDATLYSFLITILWSPIPGPLTECTKSFENLSLYCQRTQRLYYSQ